MNRPIRNAKPPGPPSPPLAFGRPSRLSSSRNHLPQLESDDKPGSDQDGSGSEEQHESEAEAQSQPQSPEPQSEGEGQQELVAEVQVQVKEPTLQSAASLVPLPVPPPPPPQAAADLLSPLPLPPTPTPQNDVCPLCRERIPADELETHVQQELRSFLEQEKTASPPPPADIKSAEKKEKRGAAVQARRKVFGFIQATKRDAIQRHLSEEMDKTNGVLISVRQNREKRQSRSALPEKKRQKVSTKPAAPRVSPPAVLGDMMYFDAPRQSVCFLCKETLVGNSDDINLHIDTCLSKAAASPADPSSSAATPEKTTPTKLPATKADPLVDDNVIHVNLGGTGGGGVGGGYEVYTWGNETRIRVSTMLEGGFSGAGFATTKHSKNTDVDHDLEIEEDETSQYGAPQYTERQLVCSHEDEDLRDRMLGGDHAPSEPIPAPSLPEREEEALANEETENPAPQIPPNSNPDPVAVPARKTPGSELLIASLKERIKEQEKALTSSVKCLVCLDPYKVPLVSIQCWHVHCEACWLQTLGAKKLCPQCNIITSPADLRKIFL